MKKIRTRDPMARDLRQPKYRKRVIEPKNKHIPRKAKYKKGTSDDCHTP